MDNVAVLSIVLIVAAVAMLTGWVFGYRARDKEVRQPQGIVDRVNRVQITSALDEEIIGVKRVALNDGDVVVLSTELAVSQEMAERLKAHCESQFPGHKCLVLGDGLKLEVIGPDQVTA